MFHCYTKLVVIVIIVIFGSCNVVKRDCIVYIYLTKCNTFLFMLGSSYDGSTIVKCTMPISALEGSTQIAHKDEKQAQYDELTSALAAQRDGHDLEIVDFTVNDLQETSSLTEASQAQAVMK